MKTINYTPDACKGEDAKFEGYVTVRLPTFDEKYELFELSGIKVSDEGKIEMGSTNEKMKLLRTLVKHSAKFVQSCSLKRKSDGEEFKVFDDLQYDDDCHAILIQIGTALLNGFKLGN